MQKESEKLFFRHDFFRGSKMKRKQRTMSLTFALVGDVIGHNCQFFAWVKKRDISYDTLIPHCV